jgi:branched-chain amino acid transport system substrate-binding protein
MTLLPVCRLSLRAARLFGLACVAPALALAQPAPTGAGSDGAGAARRAAAPVERVERVERAARIEPLRLRLGLIEGLSGPFANAGEAVERNFVFAVERINARGIRIGSRPLVLELESLDSKGEVEGALQALQAAADRDVRVILQGNSSAVAAGIVAAVDRHNARNPGREMLFLNYSAIDPSLTREKCSFWHFRFDADLGMRLTALLGPLREDASVRRAYLINQNYSFGQQFSRLARERLAKLRPDIEIVGDDLIPIGRVKDFGPYVQKIRASGADVVLTGNWGNDLTLLVRAARESALETRFHTFYANGLGAPAAIGSAGAGRVLAVAEWHYNAATPGMRDVYREFTRRFPKPADDYFHARMLLMTEMLAAAAVQAGSVEPVAIAGALEDRSVEEGGVAMTIRAADHQVQTDLYLSMMDRAGSAGVELDIEGSGYGFRTVARLPAAAVSEPADCRMSRPVSR